MNNQRRLTALFKGLDPDGKLAVNPKSFVVQEALEIISPKKDDESLCRDTIASAIWFCRCANIFLPKIKDEKKKLLNLMNALRRFQVRIKEVPPESFNSLFYDKPVEFLEHNQHKELLKNLADLSARLKAELSLPTIRPKTNRDKYWAAWRAHDLLIKYGHAQPTKSAEGPFYKLATVLYEGITGVKDASLDHNCRLYLDKKTEKSRAKSF